MVLATGDSACETICHHGSFQGDPKMNQKPKMRGYLHQGPRAEGENNLTGY